MIALEVVEQCSSGDRLYPAITTIDCNIPDAVFLLVRLVAHF